MATVGSALTSPEAGWTRYDDRVAQITYVGSWTLYNGGTNYNATISFNVSGTSGNKVRFNFIGTKLRILANPSTDGSRSTNIQVFIDGKSVATYSEYGTATAQVLVFEKTGLENVEHYVEIVNNTTAQMTLDAIDIDSTGTLKNYFVLYNKSLIFHNGEYKKYDVSSNQFITIGVTATENDYINNGNTSAEIASISADKWAQLTGNVEISFYTNEPNKTEVLFNIETDPFTLQDELAGQTVSIIEYTDNPAQTDSVVTTGLIQPIYLIDEWDNQTVQVIEYTDNPNQTNSTATLELVDPIMLADELGTGTVDVLYYTDNTAYTAADLEVTANYNPLDELYDPTLIAWTDDDTVTSKTANLAALPKAKVIKQTQDFGTIDRLQSISATLTTGGYGNVEFLISGNGGITWYGMNVHNDGTYKLIEVNPAAIDKVKKYALSAANLSLFKEADWKALSQYGRFRFAYYLEQYNVSDVAKIDKMVMTELAILQTPTISNVNIVYDAVDSRYYGLMFMDKNANYFSTSIGEILKYLDMGSLVAGQTSIEAEVHLVSTLNYGVDNLRLWVTQSIAGVTVEISETKPFVPVMEITRTAFASSEELVFYVRITTDRSAQKGGNFDILVKGDPAI